MSQTKQHEFINSFKTNSGWLGSNEVSPQTLRFLGARKASTPATHQKTGFETASSQRGGSGELFLNSLPQAAKICRAVNSPSCRVLFDVYEQSQYSENLIPLIDHYWDVIGYFQVGDNPGRKEPGTGNIAYREIFRHLYDRGYTGIVGMDHGNSLPGDAGELAVLKAYQESGARRQGSGGRKPGIRKPVHRRWGS